jgi:amino acid adenylation domain-containing protein
VLLTSRELDGTLPSGLPRVLVEEVPWQQLPSSAPASGVTSRNLAYVVFTSGSTGRPKGVAVEHRSLQRLLHAPRYAHLGPEETFLLIAPVSFDASVLELWGPLAFGGRLVVFPPQSPSDLDLLARVLTSHRVTTLHLTSGLFSQAVDLKLDALRGLRQVLTGGDVVSAPHVKRALQALRIPVTACYGPTEATLFTSCLRMTEVGQVGPSVPIGRPLSNTQVYLLDRHYQPVPVGVPGELFVGGPGVARGYLGRPHLTAERFIPDPFSAEPGARLYRTGDQARWRLDGVLEFLGRADNQVKVRGFRIELAEVEAALLACAGVREAVAVVREDVPGDKRLVGYLSADASLDISALRATLQQRLPEYMVPSALVRLDALPLTANAKVDRKALPAPDSALTARAFVAPRTATEQRLASVFAEVLRVEKVGLHDSFFELGGHSLLATQVISRLRAAFEVELPLRALFEAPTLERLALKVDCALQAGKALALPPLRPASRDSALPLSFAQQRLWFLDQLQPGTATYTIPSALQVDGRLDVTALQRAFDELVRRHEALRTTFGEASGNAVQLIHPPAAFSLPVVDLASHPEPQAEAERLAQQEAARPFDLARGPLLRACLLKLSSQRHVLLMTMHHIVSDGWSMGVLVREMAALYRAFSSGLPSPLPALPVQYADYSLWQRSWMEGEALEQQVSWWKQELSGAPSHLELPTDFPRPAALSPRGAMSPVRLPRELSEALEALAQREGATPFMLLLASWQLLLSRYSGQDEVVVGSPIAGRHQAETEGLIGFFVNTLVLRARLAPALTFRELLAQVRQSTLGAYEHQDVPFEKLVEELQPVRDLSRSALFQVFFALQNAPVQEISQPGLSLRPLDAEDLSSAKFELSLGLSRSAEGFTGGLQFSTDLFTPATAARMVRHLQVLLEAITAHPDQRLSELPLLTPSERQQVLVDWNRTATPDEATAPGFTFQQAFEHQAALTPSAPAVRFEEEVLSFAQLNAFANQVASYLRAERVGPNVPVALCFERSLDMVVALLGVMKAGGAYVPLDPAWPSERRDFALQDCGAPVLLTQQHLAAAWKPGHVDILCLDARPAILTSRPTRDLAHVASPEDLAYVIYTSGSTGTPKGVMVQHRSALNLHRALRATVYAGLPSGTRVSLNAPLAFDASVQQLVQLLDGHCLCIVPEATRQDPRALVDWARRYQVQALDCTPSLLRLLLEAGLMEGAHAPRLLVPGGEAIDEALWQQLAAEPRASTFNVYGPTECTVDSTTFNVRPGTRPTIGGPLANVRVYVLDAHLRPVPVGVPGELFIAGEALARGYLNRPALTAERFLCDPFSPTPGARMYRTGDKARWQEDGTLEYLGRTDFQVKLRGFRIELGEIEAALARHPSVRDTVVVVREDSPGDKRLVAYFTPRAATPEVAELRAFLKEQLPEYMVPAAFVALEALPLTSNGKVDRRALPAPDASLQAATYEAPATPTEERLAALWAEVLRVEKVGRHDDFFALGGHSLLATQVVARVRKAFEVELSVRALFEAPALAALALRVGQAAPATALPPLRPAPRDEAPLPLSFAQQRLWFLDQLQPGSPTYNIPFALRLDGVLDVSALQRAFEELVHRHEALRTTFHSEADQPSQRIHAIPSLPLEMVDLTGLPDAQRLAEARRLATEDALRPFHLATGPLLRVTLLRLGTHQHVLLVCMHHIVSDGWSTGVLVREVTALYEAFQQGRPSPLPALPVQYADYALWQRQWLQGAVLDAQLGWWRQQLSGAPAHLELPTDFARPPVLSHRGLSVPVRLPRELSESLKALARREGATPFMLLLAAFQLLLSRYSGQEDVVVGSPIAGRRFGELEGLIGFFVNTLALRSRLDDNPSFRTLLGRARETTLGAHAHQDVPFEKLVEELHPVRDLSRSPLFQALFVLQNTPQQALSLPSLSFQPLEAQGGEAAKFELNLGLTETPEGFAGVLQLHADLFTEATGQRMAGHLQVLLEAIVAHPDQRVSELPLLTAAERQQVLHAWNDTAADFALDSCFHHAFEQRASLTPDWPAARYEKHVLSFAQLNARANQLAHSLRSLGVGPNVTVALCLERSLDAVAALLGVMKAGGAYVPLDPAWPTQRREFVLQDCGAPVLLTQQHLATEWTPGGVHVLCLDTPGALADQPAKNPAPVTSPEDLAYVIYTSGSTGMPKGVMVQHRSLLNLHQALRATVFSGLAAGTRLSLNAPLAFDATVQQFVHLLDGHCLCIVPDATRKDPRALVDWVRRYEVQALEATPSLLRLLLEAGLLEGPSAPELLLPGGEAMDAATWQVLSHQERTRTINLYGPTECTVENTSFLLRPGTQPTIGRPLPNMRVYVLDAHLRPVPVGVPGELFIGGKAPARGYLNRPALTAERFLCDPFSPTPGARMYRTGDKARWKEDGTLEYLGRTDFQVKLRGFRIELGEIEAALARHPAVRDTVVVVREDSPGDKRLVAYFTPRAAAPEVAELRAFLKEQLPEYMVPAAFVALEALPLMSSGKVDRRALPAPDATLLARAYVAPRTLTESRLAALWAQVLRVQRVGLQDHFFELGGHSLLATQLVARIRSELGVELPLRALFEAPTLEQLALRVDQASSTGTAPPPLRPMPRTGPVPQSFAQQRLWFLEQLQPGSPTYNIPTALRLKGVLDVAALERAFTELVRRHEALRTTLTEEAGTAVQRIHPPAPMALPVVDLSSHPDSDSEILRRVREDAAGGFDLARGPLLRASLLRLSEKRHVLLLNLHHAIADGWSMEVLVREVTALYEAFRQGQQPTLPALPVQYADYALWQRGWLQDDVLARQVDWWKGQLAGAPHALELPTDFPRPPLQSFRGGTVRFRLPRQLTRALESFSQQEGATLFMALLASTHALLSRYSGQQDLVIGSPIAGRRFAELEGLIGCFVNTLALRARLDDAPSLRTLLGCVRESTLGAYAHQDVPFEKLVEELKPQRDLSRTPLFQVMLILQNAQDAASGGTSPGGSLALHPIEDEDTAAKFDLTFTFAPSSGGLLGSISYCADLFREETVRRLATHLQVLLEAAVAQPDAPLATLPLLTSEERHHLLTELQDSHTVLKRSTLHGLFKAQAARTPDAIALIDGEERLTYRALNARSNQLARHLCSLGVGPEVRVAVCMERTADLLVALLAILKAGGAYVPLDPAYPRQRLDFSLEDSGARLLLSHQPLLDSLGLDTRGLDTLCLDSQRDTFADLPSTAVTSEASEDTLAYVIYTSGSTGRPKGVAITHASATAFLDWATRTFSPAQLAGTLAATSICFDLSVFELFAPLSVGGTVILARDALALHGLPAASAVTLINTVPSAIAELLRLRALPPSARTVNLAGEPLPGALARALYATGSVEHVFNLYGPTEDTTYSTYCRVDDGPGEPTIGVPLPETSAYVLDAYGQLQPVGVPGELFLAGAGLARGYLGRPELTAERFVPDPFSPTPGARMYRTGDLARRLRDGTLEYLGRIDFQVKVRGFRIELGEIESTLRAHPSVGGAVVLARKDAPGGQRLVAYVVPAEGHTADVEALRLHLRDKLPEYMVPSAFVRLDTFPLTPNGKVDRKALPAPAAQDSAPAREYVAPRDTLELELAHLWEELLGVQPVGATSHFFELGGHSLLAVRLMATLRERTGRVLPLSALFQAPTVEALARLLRQVPAPFSPLVPIQRGGEGRPLFCVHPIGGNVLCYAELSRLLGPEQPFYALQAQGLDGQQAPLESIEAMAALYVEAIRTVQPHGPYQLGGWSLGGVVAFEMARQLQRQGETVELLALIDPTPVVPELEQVEPEPAQLAVLFARDAARLTGQTDWLPESGEPDAVLQSLLAHGHQTGLFPRELGVEQLRALFDVFASNLRALLRYRHQPYAGRVTVLRASEDMGGERAEDLGWGPLASGGLEVADVPGDHYSVLRAPQVATVAELLAWLLEKARRAVQQERNPAA